MVRTIFTICNSTEIKRIINTDVTFYLAHNLHNKFLFKCSQFKKKISFFLNMCDMITQTSLSEELKFSLPAYINPMYLHSCKFLHNGK